jgi:hypothetical protein
MTSRQKLSLDRRDVLRAFGAAPAAALATAALPISTMEAQAYEAGEEATKARYRADSPFVQAFYRTNGYETLKK